MSATVVSLYSGGGGLDLGLHAAGFDVRLCVELDENARQTLRRNNDWNVANPGDVHALLKSGTLRQQARVAAREVTMVAGGPPCQPFSKSGYWVEGETKRLSDPRASTLGAYMRVVEELLPEVLLLENVRGLAYNGKDEGMKLLGSELARINAKHGTRYEGVTLHLNAVNFGAPQLRDRLFIVAHRDGRLLEAPHPTHGDPDFGLSPVCTAWDALADLEIDEDDPTIQLKGTWAGLLKSIPEGQNYLWHTPEGKGKALFGWRTRFWSFLLKLAKAKPSWTIQASPGPATGPFHWRNRQLATQELARLQTFPRDYSFHGGYRAAQRQIGNAVPPLLGEILGLEIRRQLLGDDVVASPQRFVIKKRADCPAAEKVGRVPKRYLDQIGLHKPHPGTGKGPAAQRREIHVNRTASL